jgi:hypothetical protein
MAVVARENETMAPRPDQQAPLFPLDVIPTHRLGKVSPSEARPNVRRFADHEASSRNSQILAFFSIVRDERQYDWSLGDIGSVFELNKGSIH